MQNTFRPKCLFDGKEHGHSTTGHILPCCYLDDIFGNRSCKLQKDLFQDHLKIENNESIRQILDSKEWVAFYKAIDDAVEGKGDPPMNCFLQCDTDEEKKRNSYHKYTEY